MKSKWQTRWNCPECFGFLQVSIEHENGHVVERATCSDCNMSFRTFIFGKIDNNNNIEFGDKDEND